MATRSNRSAKRTRDSARRRGRLAPGKTARGLEASEVAIAMDDPAIAELVALVKGVGGAPIGAYREPLSAGGALLLASLPFGAVQPTPFQRDLSPTHAKRLAAIESTGAFPGSLDRGAR
jgi:ParB family chromosome partitioning protein